jgi:hypothetical protein
VFLSVRKYSGVQNISQLKQEAGDKILPAMREADGFRSYTVVDCGGGQALSISVFDSREQAEKANESARAIVQNSSFANLPPPEITLGEVLIDNRK